MNLITFDELEESQKESCEKAGLKVFDFHSLIKDGEESKVKVGDHAKS